MKFLAKVILYELDSASIKVQKYYKPVELWKKFGSKCLLDDTKVILMTIYESIEI
jgi:hypothetical protein